MPTGPMCENCDEYEDNCSCDSEPEEENTVNLSSRVHYAEPGAACKRLVGVEVEYNQDVSIRHWTSKWGGGVHADGSCGWEAVTPPIAGKNIASCLTDLSEALIDSETTCNERCGVHVHVDASDLSWSCMYKLLAVYALLEPVLYLCAGQHRMTNRYCGTVGNTYARALGASDRKGAVLHVATSEYLTDSHSVLPVATSGRQGGREATDKKGSGRYKGLNILPWIVGRKHRTESIEVRHERSGPLALCAQDYTGAMYPLRLAPFYSTEVRKLPKAKDCTVEFRLHKNTLDAKRLIGWATLCRDIVEWCSKASDKDLVNLPTSALRALCEHVAPNSAAWVLKRVREWRHATTSSKATVRSNDGLDFKAQRRISIKNGVYSCAA